jgi:GT2 family glycosyltransferase
VVILNYNGGDLAVACAEHFVLRMGAIARIILVDNDSTDGTDQRLSAVRGADFIQTGRNLGYTGGNNVGIRRALDLGAEYVLVVNNDVEIVNAEFLRELVAYMDAHPQIAIAGPKVYFQHQGEIQNTLCAMPKLFRQLYRWPLEKLGLSRAVRSGMVELTPEVLNGVCILIRGDFLRRGGLMDEPVFMYLDDTDLAIRARAGGYELAYVPVESIVHKQKAKGYEYFGMVDFLLKRNTVYVLAKHNKKLEAFGYAVLGLALCICRAFLCLFSGRQVGTAWRFIWVLGRAEVAALRLDVHAEEFGPPMVSWSDLMQRR